MMHKDILQFIEPVFPTEAVRSFERSGTINRRNRVYTEENTLLTMVVAALHEDRSLQNSVNIFQEIFHRNCEAIVRNEAAAAPTTTEQSAVVEHTRGRGRPRSKTTPSIPISMSKEISSNTAAFSKARNRLEQGLIDRVFAASTDFPALNCVQNWHGRLVINTDGTYFQMQDTAAIPEKYRVQKNSDGTTQGYPQGLLQVLTQHGTGFICSYRIGGRSQSELDILCDMLDDIPKNSLLLADDLYNCYALFCLLPDRHIDIIVPDKKERPYRVLKSIAPGDEIVEISKPHHPIRPLIPHQPLPPRITLRRISYRAPEHPEETRAILTTIFDESIERTEFIHKFSTRWDVEITIREIKTIMGIHIARSKSEEMVFREMGVALLAYNLVRTIIAQGAEQSPFPPETDLFQKLYSTYTPALVDRKGRVYSRWSPGRPPHHNQQTQKALYSSSARQTVPKEN